MSLPPADAAHLEERNLDHEVIVEPSSICVILKAWPLPVGYDRHSADLLLRLPPGYPDVAPDMWWFDPAIHRADGAEIPATQVVERHAGRDWQRWSRHFAAGQWQSGIDGVESYLALIRREVEQAVVGVCVP